LGRKIAQRFARNIKRLDPKRVAAPNVMWHDLAETWGIQLADIAHAIARDYSDVLDPGDHGDVLTAIRAGFNRSLT
jgi:hypothetical protein